MPHNEPVPHDEARILQRRTLRTKALAARDAELTQWLNSAHKPSEGAYLEELVRTSLREVLPTGVQVSTGFISSVHERWEPPEPGEEAPRLRNLERGLSRQFDVIVWDSAMYPPLFRRGDVVVVAPHTVIAVVEVTTTLDARKLREDLEKLDSLNQFYAWDLTSYRPVTAIVGFSGGARKSTWTTTTLQALERHHYYDSTTPPSCRLERIGALKTWEPVPRFVDVVCALDERGGFVRCDRAASESNPFGASIVCQSYPHDATIRDGWGLIEDTIIRWAVSRDRQGHTEEGDRRISLEWPLHPLRKSTEHVLLTTGAFDAWITSFMHHTPRTPHAEWGQNVGKFAAVDTRCPGHPRLYVRNIEPAPDVPYDWAFESYSAAFFGAGKYKGGQRVGKWRLFFDDGKSMGHGTAECTGSGWASGDEQFASFPEVVRALAQEVNHPAEEVVVPP